MPVRQHHIVIDAHDLALIPTSGQSPRLDRALDAGDGGGRWSEHRCAGWASLHAGWSDEEVVKNRPHLD
jgi:hypothetical protein